MPLATHWRTIIWVWQIAWQTAARLLLGLLVTMLLESLLPVALVWSGRGLINGLVAGIQQGDASLAGILPWVAAGAILSISLMLISNLGDYWQQCLHEKLNLHVGLHLLRQADRLDLAVLERSEIQDQTERLRKQGGGVLVAQALVRSITILNQSVRLGSLVAILLWIEPLLVGWLGLLALPYLYVRWQLANRSYAIHHQRSNQQRWATYFVQVLTDQRWLLEVKFFQLAPLFLGRFQTTQQKFLSEDRQLARLAFGSNAIFASLAALGLYALFGRIARNVLTGALTIGDVAIYTASALQMQGTVQNLLQSVASLNEQLQQLKDLQGFFALQSPECIPISGNPVTVTGEMDFGYLRSFSPVTVTKSARPQNEMHPSPSALVKQSLAVTNSQQMMIEFDNVSFFYAGQKQPAVANLSFCLKPGETVALVGENGSGKSTITKLLAGLYEPSAGSIRVGGCDLRQLDQATWQAQIGIVFQNFTSYEASIEENIAYGNWPAHQEKRLAIEQLARFAQADGFINHLAQGYATVVGRRFGSQDLSSGQWQRLAIARGLARSEAKLLILDEPSASLDVRAEYELFSHFRQAAVNRITLLISHRFSTLCLADRILVLEKGRLTECGTHGELLRQGGHYAKLYGLYQVSSQ